MVLVPRPFRARVREFDPALDAHAMAPITHAGSPRDLRNEHASLSIGYIYVARTWQQQTTQAEEVALFSITHKKIMRFYLETEETKKNAGLSLFLQYLIMKDQFSPIFCEINSPARDRQASRSRSNCTKHLKKHWSTLWASQASSTSQRVSCGSD